MNAPQTYGTKRNETVEMEESVSPKVEALSTKTVMENTTLENDTTDCINNKEPSEISTATETSAVESGDSMLKVRQLSTQEKDAVKDRQTKFIATAQVLAYENIISDREMDIKSLRKRVNEINVCNRTLEKEASEFKSRISTFDEEQQMKDNIIKDLEERIAVLNSKVAKQDGEIKHQEKILEQTVEKTKTEINDFTEKLIQKESDLVEYREQIAALNGDTEKSPTANNTVDELIEQINSERSTYEKLECKLEDQLSITRKTEEILKTAQDLVSTKDLLINSLQEQITIYKKMHSADSITADSDTSETCADTVDRKKVEELRHHYEEKINLLGLEIADLKEKNENVLEPSSNVDSIPETLTLKSGVKETCEFIEIQATYGCIMDSFLLWADIQRKMHPEKTWKAEAEKKFVKSEITDAKETLWRIVGEEQLGKMTKRQGAAKYTSEINDICSAMKTLSEKGTMPMVAKTPLYSADCIVCQPSSLNDRLNKMDKSMDTMINAISELKSNGKQPEKENSDTEDEATKKINTDFGRTISIADVTNEYEVDNEEGFQYVENKKSKQKKRSQELNENSNLALLPAPTDVDLVVYGLDRSITAVELKEHFAGNNVNIKLCELLTKYEQARSLSFKIRVSKIDAEKIVKLDILTESSGVRPYTISRPNIKGSMTVRNNTGSVNKTKKYEYPQIG